MFNNELSEDIFYEGCLYYDINLIQSKSTINYKLNVFLPYTEEVYTTCLLVDNNNKIIYLSPVTKNCYLDEE